MSNRKRKKAEKKRTRPQYADGLKETVVARMRLGECIVSLSEELGIHRSTLHEWKRHGTGLEGGGGDQSPEGQKIRELAGKVGHLEAALGRKELELDFFVGALRRVEDLSRRSSESGGTGCTTRSGSGRKAS